MSTNLTTRGAGNLSRLSTPWLRHSAAQAAQTSTLAPRPSTASPQPPSPLWLHLIQVKWNAVAPAVFHWIFYGQETILPQEMARLEDLTTGTLVKGILSDALTELLSAKFHGSDVAEVVYKDAAGRVGTEIHFRDREPALEIVTSCRPWSFDGDGRIFRLVSEPHRIRLGYLFDPHLAVHTSFVEPLPHQATHYPIRALDSGEQAAGESVRNLGLVAEAARDLRYGLYSICERRKWAQDALGYNVLVLAWPDLQSLARKTKGEQTAQEAQL